MPSVGQRAGLAWYYLATPLFAVADLGLGWPVRVAGLEDPLHRGVYYGGLILLAVVVERWPASGPWVGMAESVVNLVLLLLSVLLPIWSYPERIMAGEGAAAVESIATVERLANVLLSGVVLIVAFHRYRGAAVGRLRASV